MDSSDTNEPDCKKLMLLDRAPGLGNRMVSMLADYEAVAEQFVAGERFD